MISLDFAPNEERDDALYSISLLFQPWRWRRGDGEKRLNDVFSKLFPSYHFSYFFSGRSALFHLLKSLNLPNNSSVAVTGFTCSAVALPVIHAEMTPIYIDIEKETYAMTFSDLKKKWNDSIRVIILQHTFGLTPKSRDEILSFAREKGVIVIEDLAHGLNPELHYQSYVLLSFGRSKWVSSVFGAAIGHPDKKLPKATRLVPSYLLIKALLFKPLAVCIQSTYDIYIGKIKLWFSRKIGLIVPELSKKEKTGEWSDNYDFDFPNAFALLLIHQLNKKIKGQQFRNRTPQLVNNRDAILTRLKKKNIFLGSWYTQPVAPKGLPLSTVSYKQGSCPIAEDVCAHIINLPLGLRLPHIQKMIDEL